MTRNFAEQPIRERMTGKILAFRGADEPARANAPAARKRIRRISLGEPNAALIFWLTLSLASAFRAKFQIKPGRKPVALARRYRRIERGPVMHARCSRVTSPLGEGRCDVADSPLLRDA
jgi:hypothetical protein